MMKKIQKYALYKSTRKSISKSENLRLYRLRRQKEKRKYRPSLSSIFRAWDLVRMTLIDFTKKKILGVVLALVERFFALKRVANFIRHLQVMNYSNTADQSIYGEIITARGKL